MEELRYRKRGNALGPDAEAWPSIAASKFGRPYQMGAKKTSFVLAICAICVSSPELGT